MEKITRRAKDLARCYGASAVGVVTAEMLVGGPPSTDLSYVLPHAKSAISFAVPFDPVKKENKSASIHFILQL